MSSTRVGSKLFCWFIAFLFVAGAGASLGYYFGNARQLAREPAQPIIDALSKALPASPVGKLVWQKKLTRGFSGPNNYQQVTAVFGDSIAIDISDASNHEAIGKIISFYEQYYADAARTTWNSVGGNPKYSLGLQSDGTFTDTGGDHGWYKEYASMNCNLRIDGVVIDFAITPEVGVADPNFVNELRNPVNGRRILWLRCAGRAHNLYGPARLP